ncbi:MAG: glycosyltransferase family 39 protein [Patescibacteria group bacterium]
MTINNSRLWGWLTVGLICVVSFALMLYSSNRESAIMDELAHIPAGYGYVRYLDFRLNPEHPPLLKAASGIPLLFADLKFPTESRAWVSDINGQWEAGSKFLYESGNNADKIIRLARLAPILLTLLLIIFVYFWSAQLLGYYWGILPALFTGLSPNILAHGHYVTTDVAAAFGIAFGAYFFIKFLLRPAKRNLLFAGLAFGVAQLAKFSAVLLIPYFLIIITVFYIASVARDWTKTQAAARLKRFGVRALRYYRATIIIFVIGYALVVYPVYTLFTWNYPQTKQTADTEFVLSSFAGGPTPEGATCKPMRCLAELNIGLTKNPVTRPAAHYMLGVLMVLQRSSGGNNAYFMGEVSAGGSPWYFPLVYALKEPLPILIVILIGLFLGLKRFLKATINYKLKAGSYLLDYLSLNFTEFSMLVFVVIYWAWSIQSPLNIGFRHLFPALPFMYILAAGAWKKWVAYSAATSDGDLTERIKRWAQVPIKNMALLVIVLALVAETAMAAPYFISYFNQFGNGTGGGYRYATDSNYDWGQDLLRLKEFVDGRNNDDNNDNDVQKIAVDYFGGGSPKYYLGDKEENWWSSRGNPADEGIKWLAVSVNALQGAIQPTAPGFNRKPEDEYQWLVQLRPPKPGIGNVPEPDYKAGTSIFIYKL